MFKLLIKCEIIELDFPNQLGIFLSFTTTFVIVAKPCQVVCGLMRFAIGFCYTACYATVVTKVNRVSRIFSKSPHPRFISPLSSTLIVLGLISVEIVILSIWLLVEPPRVTHITVPPTKRVLVCRGLDTSIMSALVYPFFLIVLATLYAFKTRKSPCGFNETKFIFFANTVTTIHWFAYVPLYLAAADLEIRAVILAFSLSLSGVVQLCCLILPKVYTVLFRPQRNTRRAIMTHKSRYTIPDTPPNSVAVGMADGAALLSRVYGRFPPETCVMSVSGEIPIDIMNAAAALATGDHSLNDFKDDHLLSPRTRTMSNTIQPCERPRSRSLSVSRSTQTNTNTKESNQSNRRQITFCRSTKDSSLFPKIIHETPRT